MKNKNYLLSLVLIMTVVLACGSGTEVQNESDEDFVSTQVAATMQAIQSGGETNPEPQNQEPTITPVPQVGTRENPVPIRTPLNLVENNGDYFTITVLEAIRGDQAWQMIYQANQFNSAPEEGKEYILIKVRVEFTNSTVADNSLSISGWNFGTISNNQLFDDFDTFVAGLSPELSFELLPGGVGEGYYVGLVFKDDANAMIYYKQIFGNDKFFMAIQ